jgi:hypothetical protein
MCRFREDLRGYGNIGLKGCRITGSEEIDTRAFNRVDQNLHVIKSPESSTTHSRVRRRGSGLHVFRVINILMLEYRMGVEVGNLATVKHGSREAQYACE